MKPTKLIFIALMLCCISMLLAQTAEHKTYDYIIILADIISPTTLYVSNNAEKYEEIKIDKRDERFDYTEVIKFIKRYEKEGYEISQSNISTTERISGSMFFFLLRREQKK
ncbi:MAG TPA: hypothetical protein VI757_16295 [Bacteroidia bacterium]|nr:hypothetical protein [Bacteroidia bacterium]